MKPHLFILPALASTLVIVVGCQSESNPNPPPSAGGGSAVAAPAAPSNLSVQPGAAEASSTKVAPSVIRIKAGGAAMKDSSGHEWLADTGFTGGDIIGRPDLQIVNTKDPDLYHSEHYSMDSFAYKVPNGNYQVKLHFCETYEGITGPAQRVFTFEVGGKKFKDFDVWVKAGGFTKPYVETVPVKVIDGQIKITFTPQVENPQINAIEIIPAR